MSLLAKGKTIRQVFERKDYRFYAPNFLIVEIFKHKEKVIRLTKASEDEVNEYLNKSLRNIHFVNEELISTANFIEAYKLCKDIDEKDTPFIALTLELEGVLWTSDKKLTEGLTRKGFTDFFE